MGETGIWEEATERMNLGRHPEEAFGGDRWEEASEQAPAGGGT